MRHLTLWHIMNFNPKYTVHFTWLPSVYWFHFGHTHNRISDSEQILRKLCLSPLRNATKIKWTCSYSISGFSLHSRLLLLVVIYYKLLLKVERRFRSFGDSCELSTYMEIIIGPTYFNRHRRWHDLEGTQVESWSVWIDLASSQSPLSAADICEEQPLGSAGVRSRDLRETPGNAPGTLQAFQKC